MTREETTKILAVLKAAYPNSYRNMTQQEALGTVAVWQMQFADMPSEIVMMALQKCISTSAFPPSVYEVKKKIGALYWEAYELLTDSYRKPLPEKTEREIRLIYDKTKDYKYDKPQEPSLNQMIGDPQTMRLLGGSSN